MKKIRISGIVIWDRDWSQISGIVIWDPSAHTVTVASFYVSSSEAARLNSDEIELKRQRW